MKKIISLALAALMAAAISTTAFAASIDQSATLPASQGTAVSYEVKPTYSVTIPESVELTKQTNNTYTGSDSISTTAVRLKKNDTICVKIESDFEMETLEGAKQAYTVTKNKDTAAVANGDIIAKFGTSETAQSVTLNYSSPNPEFAGEYKDTVTFTISITDNRT